MPDREKQYQNRESRYNRLIQKQTRIINAVSNLRLLVFVTGAAGTVILIVLKLFYISAAFFIAFAVLFGYLVIMHRKYIENKSYSEALCKINNSSLKRIYDEWYSFTDTGEEFKDDNHSYSQDLDIFGKASLFQWINTAKTFTGRKRLRTLLAEPEKSLEGIISRQEAVSELAANINWRQRLEAEGMVISHGLHDPGPLFGWIFESHEFYIRPWVVAAGYIIPAISAVLIFLWLFLHAIPYFLPVAALLLQFAILKYKSKERDKIFSTAYKYRENIRAYCKMLKTIENKKFSSAYLNSLKNELLNCGGTPASGQINGFLKIVDSISNRNNAFYLIFDILILWDYHIIAALEHWKLQYGRNIRKWLDAIGEFEALSSLAVIRFDHPEWVFPEIKEGCTFYTEAMGHPLLGRKRVCNDLEVGFQAGILLITGSNMSGKSTMLRTAGINLVLAYSGAPVCAGAFSCSIMDVYACMRISDSIEKSISSFYAELLRIKMIVNAAGESRIFFLLDEVFKGTNSRDRHTGARVLIKKLLENGAVGLVSTHDMELGDLEEESGGRIKNYHFEEYYENGGIFFDYRLRRGISTTRNAVYLMKMAGIDVK